MSVQDQLVIDTHAKTETALRTVTQLSAQLREIYGQYEALGGQTALAGYPWPEGYTEADFITGMTAVAQSSFEASLQPASVYQPVKM